MQFRQKNTIQLLFGALFMTVLVSCQVEQSNWEAKTTVADPLNAQAPILFNRAIVDQRKNIYITGRTDPALSTVELPMGSEPNSHIITEKYNAEGKLQWSRIYENPVGNSPNAGRIIAQDAANNIYVAGDLSTTADRNVGSIDVVLLKYDPNGNLLWQKSFTSVRSNPDVQYVNNLPWRLAVTRAGEVYLIAASTYLTTSNAYNTVYTAIVYNGAGVAQRQIELVNFASDSFTRETPFYDFEIDSKGNVYSVETPGLINFGFILPPLRGNIMKHDANGNVLWSVPVNEYMEDITLDNAENLIALSGLDGNSDAVKHVHKYDSSSGTLLWSQAITNVFLRTNTDVAVDAADNVYVGLRRHAPTSTAFSPSQETVVIKIDSIGNVNWQSEPITNPDFPEAIPGYFKIDIDSKSRVYFTDYFAEDSLFSMTPAHSVTTVLDSTSANITNFQTLGVDAGWSGVDQSNNFYLLGGKFMQELLTKGLDTLYKHNIDTVQPVPAQK